MASLLATEAFKDVGAFGIDMTRAESLRFMREYCTFGEKRAYILMGIARRKHNENITNSGEKIFRRLLTDRNSIEYHYDEIRAMMESHEGLTFRLYMTANARNLIDAYFHFRDTMNGWTRDLINGDDAAMKKFGRIDSEWISHCHKPETKDDSYFHWDIDDLTYSESKIFYDALAEHTEIITSRETPNGWHIISEPFNYTEFEPPFEYDDMDTDGQLFIEEIET